MLIGMDYRAIYTIILATSFIVNVCYAAVLKKQVREFEFTKFYSSSVAPLLAIIATASLFLNYLSKHLTGKFVPFILFTCIAVFLVLLIAFFVALNKHERCIVLKYFCNKFHIHRN